MITKMFRDWWMFLVRGLAAIIFGALALIWPEQAKLALVLLFGAYVLVDGIFSLATGIGSYRYFARWWALLLEGVAGICIGVLTFFWPNITGLALLYFIAAWVLITGIFEIVAAIQLRRVLKGEWMLILGGLLSIVYAVLLFALPGAGAASLVWLIGIYAIIFGILLMILAFRLRGTWHDFQKFEEAVL